MATKDPHRKRSTRLVERYRVTDGRSFQLDDVDPRDTGGLGSETKPEAQQLLARSTQALADAQERLYAQDRQALLLIFQAMDAAGKDSTIKHVMSGVNPQGCEVRAFKAPTSEELDHDYLWRCVRQLPARGHIGIFNRSYYEEVLVVRVHREILRAQKLPSDAVHKGIFKERLEDIAWFERYLARNGIRVLKFFLHVSKKEQKRRFLERLDTPWKNWKFSAADVKERECWGEYMKAYENAIRATASDEAPWFVVPADHKWFTRLVVSAAIVHTMEGMGLEYPAPDATEKAALAAARRLLAKEG